jgi:hypothetical protein
MEILSSGSFVNLENQGKIEQLIYTAREIAAAAVGTDGFVSEEENNRRLALEIWQGAEYMTRDHEEGQVKNIFINNFLDRLRELGGAPKMPNGEPENSAETAEEDSPDENAASRDEFLGFVGTAEVSERESTEQASPDGENTLETADESVAEPVSNTDPNSQEEKAGDNFVEPDNSLTEATLETENGDPEKDESQETNQPAESDKDENSQVGANPKQNVSTITLPEKEPYQFDKCTVTATIQLLPVGDGIRRAVLSVRTHDFAPQISVVELNDGATPAQLLPALQSAFDKYKTDLPVKVMDKMKREKSAGKKQPVKTAVETKPDQNAKSAAASAAKPETEPVATVVPKAENNQAATTATVAAPTPPASSQAIETARRSKAGAKNAKPEDDRQGNLFGF